jgi:hypothetical protein
MSDCPARTVVFLLVTYAARPSSSAARRSSPAARTSSPAARTSSSAAITSSFVCCDNQFIRLLREPVRLLREPVRLLREPVRPLREPVRPLRHPLVHCENQFRPLRTSSSIARTHSSAVRSPVRDAKCAGPIRQLRRIHPSIAHKQSFFCLTNLCFLHYLAAGNLISVSRVVEKSCGR